MKNNFIKFFTLIIAIIISISCGNEITPPENDNDNKIGKVIVVDADKTYTVRIGSIITNIKPSDMTNAWKNYIGGKKVLKPDGKTDLGWYFDKETGNYHEPTFSTSSPRANLVGVVIMSNHGEAYLMGMYYNNKILGEGFSQYMLIYIQADGQERGYYGGGSDKNKKPDYSTVWTHYAFPVDPLGILEDNDISKDPDPEQYEYKYAILSTNKIDFILPNAIAAAGGYFYLFRDAVTNKHIGIGGKYSHLSFDRLGRIIDTNRAKGKVPSEYLRDIIYLTNKANVYYAGVYFHITNNFGNNEYYTYRAYCIDYDNNILVFSAKDKQKNLANREQFNNLVWKKEEGLNYSLLD